MEGIIPDIDYQIFDEYFNETTEVDTTDDEVEYDEHELSK